MVIPMSIGRSTTAAMLYRTVMSQRVSPLRYVHGPVYQASTSSSSSSPTSTASSASPRPRRSSAASRRLSARRGADFVGPPDAVSNLRPVIYSSAFEDQETPASSPLEARSEVNSNTNGSLQSHPYSTAEFGASTPSTSTMASSRRDQRPHSAYYLGLLDRLEAAELTHHLRLQRTDRFSQAFWSDNNARYAAALDQYKQGLSTSSSTSSSSSANASPAQDLLAPFYTAWLRANRARHRAYNEKLWAMTKDDLAPAMRYQILRWWVGWVAWLEAKRGRGVATTSSLSSF
ncbi:unnamed protein product [Jaminaea pallidilutea]